MAWHSSFGPPSSKQVDVLISVRKKSLKTSYEAFLMEFRNKIPRHFQSLSNKTITSDFRVTMWLAFSQKSRNCLSNLDTLQRAGLFNNMRWSFFFCLVNRRILNRRNRYENTYKISLDLIRFWYNMYLNPSVVLLSSAFSNLYNSFNIMGYSTIFLFPLLLLYQYFSTSFSSDDPVLLGLTTFPCALSIRFNKGSKWDRHEQQEAIFCYARAEIYLT